MDIIASYSSSDSENDVLERENSRNADYFNLESSDTDDDLDKNSVHSLLISANVLNDGFYGPSFPMQNDAHPECSYLAVINDPTKPGYENISNEKHKIKVLSSSEDTSSTASDDKYPKEEEFFYRSDSLITQAVLEKKSCQIPKCVKQIYKAHIHPVTSLHWCIPQYSHLFLSASTDCNLKVWDMTCKYPAKVLKFNSGLKACKWSSDGRRVVCGGFGKAVYVIDIFTGKEIAHYPSANFVTAIANHPEDTNVFLVGTKNNILAFDARIGETTSIQSYSSKFDEVLDIAFLNGQEFICSTSIVSHDSADRTIMAWDFSSGAILSNQIYLERYTCPSLKVDPSGMLFIAQTNGDYITAFSTKRPYKMKNKQYIGHKVSGYGIQCDISPDEKYLISGDTNGYAFIYNYQNTSLLLKLPVNPGIPINCVQWHPVLPRTIATSDWNGNVHIWK